MNGRTDRQHPDDPTQRCSSCGGRGRQPATRRDQVARWFVYGRGAAHAWSCQDCPASWSGGGGYRPRGRRRRAPLDGLHAQRTWFPMPLFYAAVGLVAALIAVPVVATTRLPWPAMLVVPVAAMSGVHLLSLVGALRRRRV